MYKLRIKSERSRRSRAGFTLVELLVVIGIIALLIAMLMPALNRARFQAKTVQCQSNLRQLGQAMALYLNDSKNFYPPGYWHDGFPGSTNTLFIWAGKEGVWGVPITKHRLNAYLGKKVDGAKVEVEVAHCPADIGDDATGSASVYDYEGTSYRWNHYYYFRSLVRGPDEIGVREQNTGVNSSRIRRPSEFVVAHDTVVINWTFVANDGGRPYAMIWHSKAPYYKWNMLFADGHVALTRALAGKRMTDDYRMNRD